jgi:hypothetical protein
VIIRLRLPSSALYLSPFICVYVHVFFFFIENFMLIIGTLSVLFESTSTKTRTDIKRINKKKAITQIKKNISIYVFSNYIYFLK